MNFNSAVLKYLSVIWVVILSLTLFTSSALSASFAEEQQEFVLSEAELAQTLAPIALYPDTLLTHILIASTYPIEVIEADRWLNKNTKLTVAQVEKKAEKKDWDVSIKALLAFPQVIDKLSADLTWMQKLGDAFLQDEERVLASIQTLRQQADEAGSLANIDNVKVIKEQRVIIIEPAQPEIIYVPYYDTRLVYGRWYWSHYPPVYWHSPAYYTAHHSPFYWGHGVHISSRFYFSTFNWHNRHVVVNHHNRFNRHGYHSRKKIVTSHQAKRWSHQPKHRRGVAYSSGRVKKKYYGSSVYSHKNVNRNRNVISGSNHHVKSYKSTSQVNRHKDFNKKLKVKSHNKQTSHKVTKAKSTNQVSRHKDFNKKLKVKSHNKQTRHEVNKTKRTKHVENKSFKRDKTYTKYNKPSGNNVYKAKAPRSKPANSKRNTAKVNQATKHSVSSKRHSVKKSAVHSRPQHKSKAREH